MSAILKQRNYFVTKRFEITPTSLKLGFKSQFGYAEHEYAFEQIFPKYYRQKKHNLFTLIPALLCFMATIITILSHFIEKDGSSVDDILVYGILWIILTIISAFNYEDTLTLSLNHGMTLAFYTNSPNPKEVESFIALLFSDQKKYLLNRYAKSDPYLSVEQLSTNLKWLWDRNIINDAELEDLRKKILPAPSSASSIGFNFNPNLN